MSKRRRLERNIGALAAVTALVTLVVGLAIAPPDRVQGQAMRLMYVHVPAAWTAYLTFAVVLVASIAYAIRREALQHKVTHYTTLAAARAAAEAHRMRADETVNRLQDLHRELRGELRK